MKLARLDEKHPDEDGKYAFTLFWLSSEGKRRGQCFRSMPSGFEMVPMETTDDEIWERLENNG